jgi:hypothetical protein
MDVWLIRFVHAPMGVVAGLLLKCSWMDNSKRKDQKRKKWLVVCLYRHPPVCGVTANVCARMGATRIVTHGPSVVALVTAVPCADLCLGIFWGAVLPAG